MRRAEGRVWRKRGEDVEIFDRSHVVISVYEILSCILNSRLLAMR